MIKKLRQSPINYFSDLFIIAMVIAWIAVIVAMTIMGIYSTIVNQDNSIWSELQLIVTCPITAGAGIWMIKNSIQHAIASNKGIEAPQDFPDITEDELDYEFDEMDEIEEVE